MKRVVLFVLLALMVVAGAFAQNRIDRTIDRRTRNEPGYEHYIVFYAYPGGTILPNGKESGPGHVFVEFTVKSTTAFSFTTVIRGMNRAETWYDLSDWGGVREEDTRLVGLATRSLKVFVDSTVYNSAINIRRNNWYFLYHNDCVEYASEIAGRLGLRVPVRITSDLYPIDWINTLMNNNS